MNNSKKIIIILVAICVIIAVYFLFFTKKESIYSFEGTSFSYSQTREKPDYTMSFNHSEEKFDVYNINFKSRPFLNYSTRIYGLLYVPKGKTNVPGILFLPGGGVSKEAAALHSGMIANQSIAVLTIDQRGIGQTGGYYLDLEKDYNVFRNGNEPVQHLSVYDALASFDVLREIKEVDEDNIALAGESMGGRYAIIATALDTRIKGAIVISSAGLGMNVGATEAYYSFIKSIDPDNYVSRIAPRPIFMLQGNNDSVVPLSIAQKTFSLAGEPKKFFIADGCGHGFCEKMRPEFESDLRELFKK